MGQHAKIITKPELRIINYKSSLLKKRSKRALLSYLPEPIKQSLEGVKTKRFSNDGLALYWVKALSKLGYIVDVIDWQDTKFKPHHDYDLFVGHGAHNFEQIHSAIRGVNTIYFSTGSYWKFHNKQEEARFKDFERRHDKHLPYDRYIEANEEYANRSANAIVCLGNSDVASTYSGFRNVYNLPIGCYSDEHFLKQSKDYEACRYDFLFHAGGGNIHKGLDLVLDAFEKLPDNYKLTIVTPMDKKFEKFYNQVLQKPKYSVLGSLELRSQEFYDALDGCNYVILPSCSEGSPGSVVECMMQGIIPMVSKEAHIDVDNFGLVLKESSVSAIAGAVQKLAQLSPDEIKSRSKQAYNIALNQYSPRIFEENLIRILERILTNG